MSQQDEIFSDVAAIQAAVATLGDDAAAIQAEIDALKNANPALDLTGLASAVASLGTSVSSVTALVPAPPA